MNEKWSENQINALKIFFFNIPKLVTMAKLTGLSIMKTRKLSSPHRCFLWKESASGRLGGVGLKMNNTFLIRQIIKQNIMHAKKIKNKQKSSVIHIEN